MLLIGACCAALAGMAMAQLHPTGTLIWLLPAGLTGLGAMLTHRDARLRNAAVLACAACLGAARVGVFGTDSSPLGLPRMAVEGLAPLRAAAQAAISAYLPQPQAAIAAGVLLGGSSGLSPALREDLQRAGLAHLLAIDGYKQVVVAATLGSLITRGVGPRLALLPTLAVIGGYTLLSGAHPSAVRAALMASLATLAAASGRVADPLTSLALAATGMAVLEPRVLFELSLQLSVSASLGIVLLWPPLRRRLRLYRLPRPIGEPLGLSLAVTLATLPLVLGAFGQISLVSPVAHVLVMPLLPGVLVSAALLAVAAMWAPVASAAAWLAWVPSTLLVGVIRVCGSLPGAAVSTGRIGPVVALALAAALLALGIWQLPELREVRRTWWIWRSMHHLELRPMELGVACVTAAVLLGRMHPDGQLHTEWLAFGAGRAVFIRGPTGRTGLVAFGGGSGAVLLTQIGSRLRPWEHKLDVVVAFDAAAGDALGPTLARYPPDRLVHAAGRPSAVQLDLGGNQTLAVVAEGKVLEVRPVLAQLRSAPTTSAARPESAS